jgi:hypothetical protein
MIWSKYLSPMLIVLMVLVLAGCEASYPKYADIQTQTAIETEPQRNTEKSPFGFSPPTPEPTRAPNPLVPVIEKYMSDVDEFQVRQNQLLMERNALTKSLIVPSGWKVEFSALLASESKLLEEWNMIEPPEVFLGFHETYRSGLILFIERHDLINPWLETYDGFSPIRTAPWDRDTEIAADQQRIYGLTSKSWNYGIHAYSSLTGAASIPLPTPTPRSMPKPILINTRCEEAWREAASIGDMRDTAEDLYPAVVACRSLDEWNAAAAKYPVISPGVDEVLYLSNLCHYGPKSANLCQWLKANPSFIHPDSNWGLELRYGDLLK